MCTATCMCAPSLQFKPEVLAAMFQAADEEEQAAKLVRSCASSAGCAGPGMPCLQHGLVATQLL